MGTLRRQHDAEFKRNAVLLCERPDKKVSQVAGNLGVGESLLRKWLKQYKELGDRAFPGKGHLALTPDEERIRQLEKENRDLKIERDILKKATAIFSREPR
jgi:transposase-like protein